jgi:hypothetical protein
MNLDVAGSTPVPLATHRRTNCSRKEALRSFRQPRRWRLRLSRSPRQPRPCRGDWAAAHRSTRAARALAPRQRRKAARPAAPLRRQPWLTHEKLDLIVKSGLLEGHAVVLDLADHERALVWIDGRLSQVLPPGLYAYWTSHRKVKPHFVAWTHPQSRAISRRKCHATTAQ